MRFTILVVLVLAYGQAVPIAEWGGGAVPFQLRERGRILVPVRVGGRGPFQFALDTGSNRSAISGRLARTLGRQSIGHVPLVTPSGRASQAVTRIDGLVVGTSRPVTVTALIVPDRRIGNGVGADGLIGQDVLSQLTYTIDYERRQLIWRNEADGPVHGARFQLEVDERRILAVLPDKTGGRVLRLVPDTGATAFVLFARRDRPLPFVAAREAVLLTTLAGPRVARRVAIEDLTIGGVRVSDQPAIVVDAPEGVDLGDGLLPLHLFARVTISVPGRYIVFEP